MSEMPATVHGLFSSSAKRWPERPLINVLAETAAIYAIPAGEVTYAVARERVDHLSAEFAKAGFEAGQRVMLLLENRPDFFFYWLALNALGLSVVPVNPDLRAAELEYMIENAAAGPRSN